MTRKRDREQEKAEQAFERREDKRKNRGFAVMDPERQREIAAQGGRASHGGGRNPGDKNADTKLKESIDKE